MHNSKFRIFTLGIVLFLLFVLFSYLVHKDLFTFFDFDTTVRLQDKISRRFDTPFSMFSLVGSFEVTSIILLLLWIVARKLKYLFVLFAFGFFHILELYGKMFVTHPGPPFMFSRYDILFSFPSSYVQPGSSYPSGHAARSAFISIILGFLISRSKLSKFHKNVMYVSIVVFDVLMFVSRVYLAEHWTSDVIGGGLLGAAFALMSLIFI